ncbi:MAG: hypothetical protein NTW25_08775 [Candidatus Kapabacteria bacterium]|nr:hypothetical protein [Candidatus Kapabacteria bacterium]
MNNNSTKYFRILLLSISLILIDGCASAKKKNSNQCSDSPATGNLGSYINSQFDELNPVIYDNTLFYLTQTNDAKQTLLLNSANIDKRSTDNFLSKREIKDYPIFLLNSPSCPSFYFDFQLKELNIYFSAINIVNKKKNRDIFTSKFSSYTWSIPLVLNSNVNSESYEAQQFITEDGKYLLFASDKEGGFGGLDIYISKKENDGSWSKAVNLGPEINTPKEDGFPFVSKDGSLYFSSNGYKLEKDFDIFKANKLSEMQWTKPIKMSLPINSDNDDISFSINEKNIYLSSNRPNGCGGYDIYRFELCAPVVLSGKITTKDETVQIDGNVELLDKNGNLIDKAIISESGRYTFSVKAGEEYKIKYQNNCEKDFISTQTIISPCDENSTIQIVSNIVLPENIKEFMFEEIDVPFFLSGYYEPITTKNLDDLKLKFSYNIIGLNENTKYIEYPSKEYYDYAPIIENALINATKFINNKIDNFKNVCYKGTEKIIIKVIGFSDPRKFSDNAIYIGGNINDSNIGFSISTGVKMSNSLLSTLRSYHTAKYIENELIKNLSYEKIKDRIIWQIDGNGIDDSEKQNEFKRRVSVKISVVKN